MTPESEKNPEDVTSLVTKISRKIQIACRNDQDMAESIPIKVIRAIVNDWLMPTKDNGRPTLDITRLEQLTALNNKGKIDLADLPEDFFSKLDELVATQKETRENAEAKARAERIEAEDRETIRNMMEKPSNPGGAGGGRRIINSSRGLGG